jgi:ribosomal protein S18 acetylase RimI-like enzyme
MSSKHVDACLLLFNQISQTNDFLYKPLEKMSFDKKFMKRQTESYDIISFVYEKEHVILGFISGVIHKERKKAYITMMLVDPTYRRQHIGTSLLNQFELFIKEKHAFIKSIDLVFFNPITLTWKIPETSSDDHPNSPGVDMNSNAFSFFKAMGYDTFAIQNSYYKDIRNYQYSKEMLSRIETLKHKDINIVYATKDHEGFDELFDNLNNPLWKKEIKEAIITHKPVLIAETKGKMIGFTGPLAVQPSLRGYFTGIGVHSDYRGLSIGKVLFSSLCYHLNEIGAHYMTLFTGENNPARHIYENEGFKIVRSWADMRKELS